MATAAVAIPSGQINAPVLKPKTGQAFLESTNFHISQDDSITRENMQSIFKSDYPAHPDYRKVEGAQPPPLSEVMHRDNHYFNEKSSETVSSFEYRYLPKPTIGDAQTKLRKTNFKMDRDLNKFKIFETMNSTYFTPKMDDGYKRLHGKSLQHSHIPQGDRDKEPQPLSDYRDKFRGHDTSVVKVDRAPVMHDGGPPTIKGDDRQGNFKTTYNDIFSGSWVPRIPSLPAPTGSNIPGGDPDKISLRETTMAASFPNRFSEAQFQPYSQTAVSEYLQKTNFKEQDGHNRYNDYRSTAFHSFQPNPTPAVEKFHPAKHRNHSDFPPGDLDPNRVSERISQTTSRYYHGNPPLGLHNRIVSGANKLTKSSVWFGEPRLLGNYYDTTNEGTFHAKTVPYNYFRGKFYKESEIPLDYYSKNEVNKTTHHADYQNPRQGKTIPNPVVIENLKKSHLFPPKSDNMAFSTTHQDTYTAKRGEPVIYDAGRLQKSSVPIGTMGPK
ncbi:hypothetical protein ACJMK2_044273 [Sinanodonta woodiana]|uniref:Uncharacterized protein n=1 Tax=Sinanodonta woodiana TaxID=1069815 RepID=A0ABD3VZH1_SINWO